MTATAMPARPAARRRGLELFRPLNEANIETTDSRRLALAGTLFPAARPGAALDDEGAAARLLSALIVTP